MALDPDILTLGLQPFMLNLGNAEQRAKSLEIAKQYDALEGGAIDVSLHDLKDLIANEIKHVPVSFMETVLAVTLGSTHVLYMAFQSFWHEWSCACPYLSNLIDVTRQVKPVHIMRRIQLELFYWFDSK